jgi:hypothetical protein
MTARGAVVAMVALFFVGLLAAGWLRLGVLTGLSFAAGCVLAARYTQREGLLTAVVTPPLIFMIALVTTELMSSQGDTLRRTLTSAAEGTVLTLASVAPWLFSGVILGLIVAMVRGLPQCVRDLRADLRGGNGRRPPGASPAMPAASAARASEPGRPSGTSAPPPRPPRPSQPGDSHGLPGHQRRMVG